MRSKYLGKRIILIGSVFLHSCISIVVPPVTLTGNKTAMEKQIIGEKAELEKDVWMVASTRSTSQSELNNLDEDKSKSIQKENQYTNEGLIISDVFLSKLQVLKADSVVGENKNGMLSDLTKEKNIRIPAEMKRKYDPALEDEPQAGEPYRMLKETIVQMNHARKLLIMGYIENRKRNFPDKEIDEEKVREAFKERYHAAALRGEYVQSITGEWSLK